MYSGLSIHHLVCLRTRLSVRIDMGKSCEEVDMLLWLPFCVVVDSRFGFLEVIAPVGDYPVPGILRLEPDLSQWDKGGLEESIPSYREGLEDWVVVYHHVHQPPLHRVHMPLPTDFREAFHLLVGGVGNFFHGDCHYLCVGGRPLWAPQIFSKPVGDWKQG
ncbi:uncharacterized protein G2W53_032708 [Senna tora]|uniref:Uncharacterized protein n=1 Tax=Senna tora TaxID=362788 RepID=A0A834W771_9FABA|nr:uncharacterized protein G2W53_032708 [Senna tora]